MSFTMYLVKPQPTCSLQALPPYSGQAVAPKEPRTQSPHSTNVISSHKNVCRHDQIKDTVRKRFYSVLIRDSQREVAHPEKKVM